MTLSSFALLKVVNCLIRESRPNELGLPLAVAHPTADPMFSLIPHHHPECAKQATWVSPVHRLWRKEPAIRYR